LRHALLTLSLILGLLVTAALLGPATSPAHAVTATRATLTFDKNATDPTDSRLKLRVYGRVDSGTESLIASRDFRAGAGLGAGYTDDCVTNKGWLPNGTYSMKMYNDYPGTTIKGRAFYLGDKWCSNGSVKRTELFIHTESGAGNVQCADVSGDQACRWEYPTWNDYKSNGCIKLSPTDIKILYDLTRQYFGTSGSGGAVPFSLSVVS
jgi:hypothetical protein